MRLSLHKITAVLFLLANLPPFTGFYFHSHSHDGSHSHDVPHSHDVTHKKTVAGSGAAHELLNPEILALLDALPDPREDESKRDPADDSDDWHTHDTEKLIAVHTLAVPVSNPSSELLATLREQPLQVKSHLYIEATGRSPPA